MFFGLCNMSNAQSYAMPEDVAPLVCQASASHVSPAGACGNTGSEKTSIAFENECATRVCFTEKTAPESITSVNDKAQMTGSLPAISVSPVVLALASSPLVGVFNGLAPPGSFSSPVLRL